MQASIDARATGATSQRRAPSLVVCGRRTPSALAGSSQPRLGAHASGVKDSTCTAHAPTPSEVSAMGGILHRAEESTQSAGKRENGASAAPPHPATSAWI